VAKLGYAWDADSVGFVAVSAASAALLFAGFSTPAQVRSPADPPPRRGVVFLAGFFKLLLVLLLCAVWTVAMLVWRYGLERVLAVDAGREIVVAVVGSLVLCIWYGLDQAFYPKPGEASD
jgi:hypothetical protein